MTNDYPPEWKTFELQQQAYKRAGWRCEATRPGGTLEVYCGCGLVRPHEPCERGVLPLAHTLMVGPVGEIPMIPSEERACPVCGNTYRYYPGTPDRGKTCSKACDLVRRARKPGSCAVCGKPLKRGGTYTCSRKCSGMLRSRKVEKICPTCGKTFSVSPAHSKKRVHCSKECQKRRVTYCCEVCGKEREVRWSETEKRFCSDECRLEWFRAAFKADNSPHWRGGAISYYGPSWRAARRAVRQRDGYRCQSCGTAEKDLPERLSVAHIISFREFGLERHEEANRLDNLICLCRSCHLAFDHLTGVR